MDLKQFRIIDKAGRQEALATYKDSLLVTLEFDHKGKLSEKKKLEIMSVLPAELWDEGSDSDFSLLGLTQGFLVKEVGRMTVKKKIALWCSLYKAEFGRAYLVSTHEVYNLARIPVSESLVKGYFACRDYWATTNQFDLKTYIREINKVVALEGYLESKGSFPGEWSPEIERSMESAQLPHYWAHLRSIGWAAVRKGGQVVKWTKKEG